MANYFEKKEEQRRELEKYYREKSNRRLKYAALASISVSIILLLIMAFRVADIPTAVMLFMRGCAGLFALVFVVLVAILVYSVNVSYFRDKATPKHKRNPEE